MHLIPIIFPKKLTLYYPHKNLSKKTYLQSGEVVGAR
nr:MAG TPA: Protein of unknown function (DUF1697) [Caudoviricetes sp.]